MKHTSFCPYEEKRIFIKFLGLVLAQNFILDFLIGVVILHGSSTVTI